MSYIRAQEVLPPEILALIQQYVDGRMIYIPRKADEKRDWGQTSGARKRLELRNAHIYAKYCAGTAVKALAAEYYLTEKSVWRIIRKMRPSDEI